MRATALGIALGLVIYVVPPPALGLEPGDLLGEWTGEYGARAGGRYTVSWILTKIEGEDVEGVFHYGGTAPYHNRDLMFRGALKGNVFTAERVHTIAGSPQASWTFTIAEDGKSMNGSFFATSLTNLKLTKRK